MRILIYSPYLHILGGGEQYIFNFVDCFKNEHEIYVVWKNPEVLSQISRRFSIDLSSIHILPFLPPRMHLREFDVIFFVSDGSIPFLPMRKSILLFMSPFIKVGGKSLFPKLKLKLINHVVCFSKYTKKYIDTEFGVNSDLIYPAVETAPSKLPKENTILSVGRFTSTLHHKKQQALIEAFIDLEPQLKGWQLIIVGGTEPGSESLLTKLRRKARSHRISIRTNISTPTLHRLYAQAKLYWHAAGFGADLRQNPQKAEHFGISVVEAMSYGAVPLVFNAGGPTEIITADSGKVWNSLKELKELTLEFSHEQIRTNMAHQAKKRAKFFSKKTFCQSWHKIIHEK